MGRALLVAVGIVLALATSCTSDDGSGDDAPPPTTLGTNSGTTTAPTTDPVLTSGPTSGPTSTASADSGTGTATSSPTTGGPTTGPSDSGSSGGLTCDGSGDCQTCELCERNAVCAIEFSTCAVDPDCGMLLACIMACAADDDPCKQACLAGSAGSALYLPYASCVFCQQCVMDCTPFDPAICG